MGGRGVFTLVTGNIFLQFADSGYGGWKLMAAVDGDG